MHSCSVTHIEVNIDPFFAYAGRNCLVLSLTEIEKFHDDHASSLTSCIYWCHSCWYESKLFPYCVFIHLLLSSLHP